MFLYATGQFSDVDLPKLLCDDSSTQAIWNKITLRGPLCFPISNLKARSWKTANFTIYLLKTFYFQYRDRINVLLVAREIISSWLTQRWLNIKINLHIQSFDMQSKGQR